MNTTRKRSWETALGTGNSELNPQGLPWGSEFDLQSASHHTSPIITIPSSLDQDIERASLTVGLPDRYAIYSYDKADDVYPQGDGKDVIEALPEPADFLQDVNKYIEVDEEVFDELSSNAVSSSRTFSTPRSAEEEGRSTGPSPATVVCYGQVQYAQSPLPIHCLLYR
jgi:hypothetical protein